MQNNENKGNNTVLRLILCLPIILIIYFAISFSNADISADEVSAVTLTLPSGKTLDFEEKADVAFYVNLYLDSDDLSKKLRDVEGETPLKVSLKLEERTIDYSVYPELNESGCFLERADGGYAVIGEVTATELLSRSECEYLYEERLLPSLYLQSGEKSTEVLPQTYSWQFKKLDGAFYSDTVSEYSRTEGSYSFYASEGGEFVFSVEPTEYTVTFYGEDGNALATDSIGSLIFPTDTELTAKVEARWETDTVAGYGGNASYSFKLLYDVLPEISVSTQTVKTGDVIVATFKHFSDNEEISLDTSLKTSELRINYDGNTAFAYLPVSLETETGEYDLVFKVGSETKSFKIGVTRIESEFANVTYDAQKYTDASTPEAIEEYEKLLATVNETVMSPYFEAGVGFESPTGRSVLHKFGTEILANGIPPSSYLLGIDYGMQEGDSVKAAERGYVVFVGETVKTGKTVILEHGYGIKTYYYHLDETKNVSEGSIVQKGVNIGIAGTTGLSAGTGLHFAVSVNGVFVNPQSFFDEGIRVPKA